MKMKPTIELSFFFEQKYRCQVNPFIIRKDLLRDNGFFDELALKYFRIRAIFFRSEF